MDSSVYGFTAKTNKGTELSLGEFKGKVLLIVNTASKCGFTPQYKGLEELHKKYADKGLVVVGFPCDQFGHQEPGDDKEIQQFCSINYGVTFPIMAKVDVNGAGAHPLFEYLRKKSPGIIGDSVKWNFTKFLVGKDGAKVKRFAPTVEPADMEQAIKTELGL